MRPASLAAALLGVGVVAPVHVLAGTHEIWWNITYVEDVNPDGLFPRRVIGVNGTWPYVPPPASSSHASSSLALTHMRVDLLISFGWHGFDGEQTTDDRGERDG